MKRFNGSSSKHTWACEPSGDLSRRSEMATPGLWSALRLCLLAWLLLSGCVSGPVRPPDLPPPVDGTTLGVGDELEIRIVGARLAGSNELPSSYKVAPDGTVNLPFIGATVIAGLEPNEVEGTVREKLISGEFYTDPKVSVFVKAYLSKRVNIIGQVKKPDSYPMEPGMGLSKLISMAGGFTELADEDRVTIRRKTKSGVKIATVSYDDIRDGLIPEVQLQSGDYVEVSKSAL